MAKNKRSDIKSAHHDDGVQFRISEVSSLLNVSASTLRQWEIVGLTAPSRTRGGYRVYSAQQVEHLKRIQSLRVKKGLNIGAIQQSLGPLEKPAAAKQSAKAREMSIGRRLRELRRSRKLTLAQAAAATEVSGGFLSCLERGQVHASISTLQKLAVFYDTTVLAFFGSSTKPGKLVRPAAIYVGPEPRSPESIEGWDKVLTSA